MAIKKARPPRKETVGAQYICFAKPGTEGEWSKEYEDEVEKTSVVKSVKVNENADSSDVYGSGEVYDTDFSKAAATIEVEVLAFPVDPIAKMRGETCDENGLFTGGGNMTRPFFGYGKVVKLKNDNIRMEWYPKCKLTENSDEISTSEEKPSEQNDTLTISAYAIDDKGNKKVYVDSSAKTFPEGLTEEKFFKKVILESADLTAALAGE